MNTLRNRKFVEKGEKKKIFTQSWNVWLKYCGWNSCQLRLMKVAMMHVFRRWNWLVTTFVCLKLLTLQLFREDFWASPSRRRVKQKWSYCISFVSPPYFFFLQDLVELIYCLLKSQRFVLLSKLSSKRCKESQKVLTFKLILFWKSLK